MVTIASQRAGISTARQNISASRTQVAEREGEVSTAQEQLRIAGEGIPQTTKQQLLGSKAYQGIAGRDYQRRLTGARQEVGSAVKEVKDYSGQLQIAKEQLNIQEKDVASFEQKFEDYLRTDSGMIQYATENQLKPSGYVRRNFRYADGAYGHMAVPIYKTPYGKVEDTQAFAKYKNQQFQMESKIQLKEMGLDSIEDYNYMVGFSKSVGANKFVSKSGQNYALNTAGGEAISQRATDLINTGNAGDLARANTILGSKYTREDINKMIADQSALTNPASSRTFGPVQPIPSIGGRPTSVQAYNPADYMGPSYTPPRGQGSMFTTFLGGVRDKVSDFQTNININYKGDTGFRVVNFDDAKPKNDKIDKLDTIQTSNFGMETTQWSGPGMPNQDLQGGSRVPTFLMGVVDSTVVAPGKIVGSATEAFGLGTETIMTGQRIPNPNYYGPKVTEFIMNPGQFFYKKNRNANVAVYDRTTGTATLAKPGNLYWDTGKTITDPASRTSVAGLIQPVSKTIDIVHEKVAEVGGKVASQKVDTGLRNMGIYGDVPVPNPAYVADKAIKFMKWGGISGRKTTQKEYEKYTPFSIGGMETIQRTNMDVQVPKPAGPSPIVLIDREKVLGFSEKVGKTTTHFGAMFVPVAGIGVIAKEYEQVVRPYNYNVTNWAKENPLEAVLMVGLPLGIIGGAKAFKEFVPFVRLASAKGYGGLKVPINVARRYNAVKKTMYMQSVVDDVGTNLIRRSRNIANAGRSSTSTTAGNVLETSFDLYGGAGQGGVSAVKQLNADKLFLTVEEYVGGGKSTSGLGKNTVLVDDLTGGVLKDAAGMPKYTSLGPIKGFDDTVTSFKIKGEVLKGTGVPQTDIIQTNVPGSRGRPTQKQVTILKEAVKSEDDMAKLLAEVKKTVDKGGDDALMRAQSGPTYFEGMDITGGKARTRVETNSAGKFLITKQDPLVIQKYIIKVNEPRLFKDPITGDYKRVLTTERTNFGPKQRVTRPEFRDMAFKYTSEGRAKDIFYKNPVVDKGIVIEDVAYIIKGEFAGAGTSGAGNRVVGMGAEGTWKLGTKKVSSFNIAQTPMKRVKFPEITFGKKPKATDYSAWSDDVGGAIKKKSTEVVDDAGDDVGGAIKKKSTEVVDDAGKKVQELFPGATEVTGPKATHVLKNLPKPDAKSAFTPKIKSPKTDVSSADLSRAGVEGMAFVSPQPQAYGGGGIQLGETVQGQFELRSPGELTGPENVLTTGLIEPRVELKYGTINAMDLRQLQFTDTSQKLKQNTLMIQDMKIDTLSKIKSISDASPIERMKQESLLQTKAIQQIKMVQATKQVQQLKQIPNTKVTNVIQGIRSTRALRRPPTPTTIIIPPIIPRGGRTPNKKLQRMAKKTELFKVYAKKFGEDVKIGTVATKREAKGLLVKELKGTLRASGYVTKGKKIVPLAEFGNFGPGYRRGKQKKETLVQLKGTRLGTAGETKSIQYFRKKPSGRKKKSLFGI